MDGVVAIIKKNDKFLLVKQSKNKPFQGEWRPPGGAIDPKEDEISALKREIKEELNLEINVIKKLLTLKSDYKTEYTHFFLTSCINENIKIDEREISDARWFSLNEIKKLKLMNITNVFFKKCFNL